MSDDTIISINENEPKNPNRDTEIAEQRKSDLIGGIFNSPENENEKFFQPKKDLLEEDLTSKESAWHISISPDGNYVLVFNHETLEFKISPFENLDRVQETKPYKIHADVFKKYKPEANEEPQRGFKKGHGKEKTSSNNPKWMIAISDCINKEKGFLYVAISYVTKSDMFKKVNEKVKSHVVGEQSEKEVITEIIEHKSYKGTVELTDHHQVQDEENGKTVIFRVPLNSINSENNLHIIQFFEVGGIAVFVHNYNAPKNENLAYFFIFNANGIYRDTFTHDDMIRPDQTRILLFDYPKKLRTELKTLYKNKSCITRLYNNINDHYFFIEQYKEGIQILQLYDLKTMEMEQVFNMHDKKKSVKQFGTPIFARSKSDRIIAYSPGFGKLNIYLKENGLEIASKDFGKDVKILFCEFFHDDETLIIIIRKLGSKIEMVLFWDLFSTSEKKIIGKELKFEKDEEITTCVAKVPGKFIAINPDGNVSSVFDKLIDYVEIEESGLELYSIIFHSDQSMVGTPNVMRYSKSKIKKSAHRIYHRIRDPPEETSPLVNNKEPWVTDDYKRISVYLDDEEKIQLFIGRSTIQVWRQDEENETFLEYIWTNNVDAELEGQSELKILELYVGTRSFCVKVKWNGLENDYVEIKWPYRDNHVTPIKHACDALEHINYRRKKLAGYKNQHRFQDMKNHISFIIWRFIKNNPDIWRLMDVRYDIMTKIIIGGLNMLVKFILFGDKKKKHRNLHVPRIGRWDEKSKPDYRNKNLDMGLTDLQIAICSCEGDNRRTLTVAYLLEYYTKNSLEHIGWLCTVSKALPDLYEYKLDHYARELFYKRCISGFEYEDFTPKEIRFNLNISQRFKALTPISNNKKQHIIDAVKMLTNKYVHPSPTVKMVPLYKFTVSNIQRRTQNESILMKFLKLAFIPRGYSEKDGKVSPFIQIVRYEKDDDIFNNPAMETAISFKWPPARNYYIRMFFMFTLYATCFAILGGNYVAHSEATGHHRNFLILIFIVFYYLGIYLVLVEFKEIRHDMKYYLSKLFNYLDFGSLLTSLIITTVYILPSFKLSNSFADAHTSQGLVAAISFTMLFLWTEFILYLRLLEPAKYLYIVLINIIKKTALFIAFMLLVVLAFSHVFLLLLQYPDFTNLTPKITSSSLTNSLTGEPTGIITQDFDRIADNPSKDFVTSFLSTYGWLRGVFVQEDTWDFWAVKALTLVASLFLVTIIQNIFIAFVWTVYEEAYRKGHAAVLRYRAELISDYECLDDIYFFPPPSDPKYIYYSGKSECHDSWKEAVIEREKEKKRLYDDQEKKISESDISFKDKKDMNSLWDYSGEDEDDILNNVIGGNDSKYVDENEDYENVDDQEVYDNDENSDDEESDNESDDDYENVNTKIKSLGHKVDKILKILKK